jgi:D-3-phosphoglycerate dehydrogenase
MATNRRKVLVPHTMGREGIGLLQARDDIETVIYPATISQAELLPMLQDCAGIALSATPYRQAEMDASPAMQVVGRIGVGFDAVEIPALTARRVPLMTAGTANSVSVAEQAFHMMIALAKRHEALDRMVHAGLWRERHDGLPMELSGKTLVIVGFGRIGTRLAKRCVAFDMDVHVRDPYVDAAKIRDAGCTPVDDLDALLPRADFVSIHCPKSPETIGMFGAAQFARMKPSAFIVNTARGGIIDEPALHAALTGGRIAAAGLDVFAQEPPSLDNPLLKLPNVLTSPHMAGVTTEAVANMAKVTAQNILSVLDGQPNRDNVINKEVLD